MRSNTCYLYKHQGRDTVLQEVEKAAAYCNLEHKEQLQIRLLAEELVGIAEGVAGECKGLFWVEESDGTFELHLQMEKPQSAEGRSKLIEISSKRKNEAALGFMGRIRAFFEESMDNYDETGHYCSENGMQLSPVGDMFDTSSISGTIMTWNLHDYEKNDKVQDKWDELERSIVARLADDVTVTMKGRHAEIVVKKHF